MTQWQDPLRFFMRRDRKLLHGPTFVRQMPTPVHTGPEPYLAPQERPRSALKRRAGILTPRNDHPDDRSTFAEKMRPPMGSGDGHSQEEQPPPLDMSH